MSVQVIRMIVKCLRFRTGHFYAIALLFPLIASCATTVKLIDPDTGIPSTGYLYLPSEEGQYPGVMVLHGGSGLKSRHHSFAGKLSGEGYVVLVVNYQPTGRKLKFDVKGIIDAGYKHLRSLPTVDMERIGMVGFSRGAGYTMDFSRNYWDWSYEKNIAGIVLYYIGYWWDYPNTKKLPPVLFLHGDKDKYTYFRDITDFCEQQESLMKKPCKYHIYKGIGHDIDRSGVANDAFSRAVNFLDQYVKGKAPSSP
jgi:carboxymethylenebutenolidase